MTTPRWLIVLIFALVLTGCPRDGTHEADPSGVRPLSNATFGFIAVGDFGSGDEMEYEVAGDIRRWAEAHPMDALVTTGDNVYPSGDDAYFDAAWHEPYGWVDAEGLRVVASLGNHDFEEREGQEVMQLLGMPGPYYEVDLADADIFVLDSNRLDDEQQLVWLRDSLAATERAWQIVVFHHPVFSCSTHGSTEEIIDSWVPVLEDHGVDLVLNGHDHNYQRFAAPSGTTYVVTGGGGHELYPLEDCDGNEPERVVADDDNHHFVTVTGTSKILRVEVVSEDEDVIDVFSIDGAKS